MTNPMTLAEQAILCPNVPGFWKELVFPLGSFRTSAMLTLTGGTTPIIGVTSNQARITWATGDTSSLQIGGFAMPRHADTCEYNDARTNLGVHMILDATIVQAGTTDNVTFTSTFYARTPGSTTQKGPFTATALATKGTVATRLSFAYKATTDANGNKVEPGDIIESWTLTPSTHGTDAVYLIAASLRYKGLVSFAKDSDRFANS